MMGRKIVSIVGSCSACLALAVASIAVTPLLLSAQSWTITTSNGYVAAGDEAVSSGTGWYGVVCDPDGEMQ